MVPPLPGQITADNRTPAVIVALKSRMKLLKGFLLLRQRMAFLEINLLCHALAFMAHDVLIQRLMDASLRKSRYHRVTETVKDQARFFHS